MQAAVGYLDGYSEMHNTPGLEPSKMYNLNANYIFKQKYVFDHEQLESIGQKEGLTRGELQRSAKNVLKFALLRMQARK